MKVVLQRSKQAQVSIDNQVHGKIDHGVVLLVGFGPDDTLDNVDYWANKISKARIFEDEQGKMNLSLRDVNGQILSISQFTLYANVKKGNRPSFTGAMKPDSASKLYDAFNAKLRDLDFTVETGIFGADMQVQLLNDGPVTLIYED